MERFRKDERQHPLPHVRTNPTSPSPILDHPNNVPGDLLELFGCSHGPSREPLERSHQRYQGLAVFSSVGERVREDTRLRAGAIKSIVSQTILPTISLSATSRSSHIVRKTRTAADSSPSRTKACIRLPIARHLN